MPVRENDVKEQAWQDNQNKKDYSRPDTTA